MWCHIPDVINISVTYPPLKLSCLRKSGFEKGMIRDNSSPSPSSAFSIATSSSFLPKRNLLHSTRSYTIACKKKKTLSGLTCKTTFPSFLLSSRTARRTQSLQQYNHLYERQTNQSAKKQQRRRGSRATGSPLKSAFKSPVWKGKFARLNLPCLTWRLFCFCSWSCQRRNWLHSRCCCRLSFFMSSCSSFCLWGWWWMFSVSLSWLPVSIYCDSDQESNYDGTDDGVVQRVVMKLSSLLLFPV